MEFPPVVTLKALTSSMSKHTYQAKKLNRLLSMLLYFFYILLHYPFCKFNMKRKKQNYVKYADNFIQNIIKCPQKKTKTINVWSDFSIN